MRQCGKSLGVEIDMKLKEMPDEMRERIVAAAEGFSEQVKRILEGEELDADAIAEHAVEEANRRTKEA